MSEVRRLTDGSRNAVVNVMVDHGIKGVIRLATIEMRISHAEKNVTDVMTEIRFPGIRSAENLTVKQIKSPSAEPVPKRHTIKSESQSKKSKANRIAIKIGADALTGMIPAKFKDNQSARPRTTIRQLVKILVQLGDAAERGDREILVNVIADHAHRRRKVRFALMTSTWRP